MGEWTAENLRFILWSTKNIPREDWTQQLTQWAGCTLAEAEGLLQGHVFLKPTFEKNLVDKMQGTNYAVSSEELQVERLVAVRGINILYENLRYLSEILEHGQGKKLAAKLQVTQSTLSKWMTGKQRPKKSNLDAISQYFNLPAGTDLRRDPIFLSLLPLNAAEVRTWLHRKIDDLQPDTLRRLLPALERLFSRP